MKNVFSIYLAVLAIAFAACSSKKNAEESVIDSSATAVTSSTIKPVTVVTWNQLAVREAPGEKGKYLTTVYLNEELKPEDDTTSEVTNGKRVHYQKVTLSDGKRGWVRNDMIGINVYAGAIASEAPIYKRPEEVTITTQQFHTKDYVIAQAIDPNSEWVEVKGKRAEDKWYTTGYVKQAQVYFIPLEANYAALTRREREETKEDMKNVLRQQLENPGIFSNSKFWQTETTGNAEQDSDDYSDPRLYGFYSLNGNANDASGHDNNGVSEGVTAIPDHNGMKGEASHFEGNSFITIHTKKPTTLTFPLTVAAWFSLDADGANNPMQTIVSMGRSANGTGFNFGYTIEDGQGKVFLGFIGAEAPISAVADVNITPDTWHYLAGTFDGQSIKLYLDGELIVTQTVNKTDADAIQQYLANSDQNVEIGRELESLGRYFYGGIDDVIIYKDVLGADDIKTIYKTFFEPAVG